MKGYSRVLAITALFLALPLTAQGQSGPQPTASAKVQSLSGVSAATSSTICEGVPNYVGISDSGRLHVRLGSGPIHSFCSVQNQDVFAMSTQACSATSALLMASMTSRQSVELYYYGPSTCESIGNWSYQPGFYFAAMKM